MNLSASSKNCSTPAKPLCDGNSIDFLTLKKKAEDLRQQNRFVEAAAKFEEALKIKPQDLPTLVGYGQTLYQQEKWDEASAKFEEVLKFSPKS